MKFRVRHYHGDMFTIDCQQWFVWCQLSFPIMFDNPELCHVDHPYLETFEDAKVFASELNAEKVKRLRRDSLVEYYAHMKRIKKLKREHESQYIEFNN